MDGEELTSDILDAIEDEDPASVTEVVVQSLFDALLEHMSDREAIDQIKKALVAVKDSEDEEEEEDDEDDDTEDDEP